MAEVQSRVVPQEGPRSQRGPSAVFGGRGAGNNLGSGDGQPLNG